METLAQINNANGETITIYYDADAGTAVTSDGETLFEARTFGTAKSAYADVIDAYNDPAGAWGFVDLFDEVR